MRQSRPSKWSFKSHGSILSIGCEELNPVDRQCRVDPVDWQRRVLRVAIGSIGSAMSALSFLSFQSRLSALSSQSDHSTLSAQSQWSVRGYRHQGP